MKKYIKAFTKAVGEEGKLTGVIGSTAAVDRYGEIIDQSSWDLKHFKKNPVILWAHNLTLGEDRPPIGKATKVKVTNNELVFDIQFDMADPFAADIFRKYKEGFLRAFSVGFIAHKVERSTDGSDAPVLKENELLELSAVPVPANPEALNQLKARSFHSRSWETMLKEVEAEQEQDDDENDGEDDGEDDGEIGGDQDVEVIVEEEETKVEAEENEAAEDAEQDEDSEPKEAITDVTPDGGNPSEENSGGSSAEPRKVKAESNPQTVAVMREAVRLLQGALTEINREKRNS